MNLLILLAIVKTSAMEEIINFVKISSYGQTVKIGMQTHVPAFEDLKRCNRRHRLRENEIHAEVVNK